ncbi:MAG: hypothetical protein RIT28_4469 [Pseudomonadota bacterium]
MQSLSMLCLLGMVLPTGVDPAKALYIKNHKYNYYD